MINANKIPGGLAQGLSIEDIAIHHNKNNRLDPIKLLKYLNIQLDKGIKIELEHTTSEDIAKEIALDHLFENPKYYIQLKKIETPNTNSGLKLYASTIKEIVDYICEELNITLPKTTFINNSEYTKNHNSFGGYNPMTQEVYVVIHKRNFVDCMRSLIHEYTHHKQNLEGRLTEGAGKDGDIYEDEANSTAGRIMREVGRKHPELFEIQL